jgi:tetratricopeptide (TPR) repeat protein
MGLAYSSVEKHKEAVECFKKAIEIEPDNESYKTNLKLAEDKLKSVGSPGQSNRLSVRVISRSCANTNIFCN